MSLNPTTALPTDTLRQLEEKILNALNGGALASSVTGESLADIEATTFHSYIELNCQPGSPASLTHVGCGSAETITTNAWVTAVGNDWPTARFNSGTTINNYTDIPNVGSGSNSSFNFARPTRMAAAIALPVQTGIRAWIAYVNSVTLGDLRSYDNPSSSGNHKAAIGFRFSVSAGDTTWMAYVGDGGAETVETTGIAPSATVNQLMEIVWEKNMPAVKFYIDGVLTNTVSTHLPNAASASISFDIAALNTLGGAGTAVALNFSFVHWWQYRA